MDRSFLFVCFCNEVENRELVKNYDGGMMERKCKYDVWWDWQTLLDGTAKRDSTPWEFSHS